MMCLQASHKRLECYILALNVQAVWPNSTRGGSLAPRTVAKFHSNRNE